jgi:hypothetical protein
VITGCRAPGSTPDRVTCGFPRLRRTRGQDLDDQLCALGMCRYSESATVTIVKMLDANSRATLSFPSQP